MRRCVASTTQSDRLKLRQDLHQFTPAQFLGNQKCGLQLDARTLHTGGNATVAVVRPQARSHLHAHSAIGPNKLPLIARSQQAIAHHIVRNQIPRVLWSAVTLQVIWRSAQHQPCARDLPEDQTRICEAGDANGTPRGKTAATVKKSAPIVAEHVVDVIAGRTPGQKFDGYTSCPLIVKEGSAMLIEFDYAGKLTPTLHMIEPLQAGYIAWLMKYRMLKPAYMATLKGWV